MARRRGLTPEDRDLWSRVAASASPLQPSRKKLAAPPAPVPTSAAVVPKQAAVAPSEVQPFRLGERSARQAMPVSLGTTPAQALRQQPVRMDAKAHKRMTKGRMAPEARLDLHGMTLAQAQPELTHFILGCQSRGLRLVLVITGKGKPGGADAPLPVRPGALRHHVPHWLQRPPLQPVVMQVAPAHHRHGGEGAYYVYLRR